MKSIFVLLLSLLVISCTNDDDLPVISACNVGNPIEELSWLKEEIERRKTNPTVDSRYCYIVQAISNNTTVFVYEDCNPLVDKIFTIYDCSGELIGYVGDENFSNENISKRQIIYKPGNFACEF